MDIKAFPEFRELLEANDDVANDPSKRGQVAGPVTIINNRYRVYPVHTRFDAVSWFVRDCAKLDSTGSQEIVGQFSSKSEALASAQRRPR